jgi:hypothetical protein
MVHALRWRERHSLPLQYHSQLQTEFENETGWEEHDS